MRIEAEREPKSTSWRLPQFCLCGYGYTTEYQINRFYRDAKQMEIGAGTSDIRRLVISDELLKRGPGYLFIDADFKENLNGERNDTNDQQIG